MTTELSVALPGTRTHPVCGQCPWFETCSGSEWEEGRPDGQGHLVVSMDHGKTGKRPTAVHTCRTCMDKSLTTDHGDPAPEKRVVPDGCPRWRERFGSACDCNSCMLLRDQYREARRPVRDASVFSDWLTAGVALRRAEKEFGPNYFDPLALKEKKRLDGAVMDAFDTSKELREELRRGQVDAFVRATRLADVLLSVVWTDPVFEKDRTDNADTWSIDHHVLEWTAALHWACKEAGADTLRLGRLWMLAFTDQPLGSRSWSRWSIDRRRTVLESWQRLIDERAEAAEATA